MVPNQPLATRMLVFSDDTLIRSAESDYMFDNVYPYATTTEDFYDSESQTGEHSHESQTREQSHESQTGECYYTTHSVGGYVQL